MEKQENRGRDFVASSPLKTTADAELTDGQTVRQAPPSAFPSKTRTFVQFAFAHGASEHLDERSKWLLTRYVHYGFTLDELKPYAGVTTGERVRQLCKTALATIWHASPPDVQQHFTRDDVITGKGHNYERTPKTRAKMSAARRGKTHSEETKSKIGAAHAGRPFSDKHKEKISAAKMGHDVKPETRAKLSVALKTSDAARTHLTNLHAVNIGSTRSDETRAKMSAAQRRRWARQRTGKEEQVIFLSTQSDDH